MQPPPERAADAGAQKRRNENDEKHIKCNSAGNIHKRLQRRLNGHEDVENAETRFLEEE